MLVAAGLARVDDALDHRGELLRDPRRHVVADVRADEPGAREDLVRRVRVHVEVGPVPADAEHVVGEGLEEGALAALARLERAQPTVLLERHPRRGEDVLEQGGLLVAQRRVVRDQRERTPVVLDRGGDRPAAVMGRLHGAALRVDVGLRLVEPDVEAQRRVVEGAPETRLRLLHRRPLGRLEQELGRARARQAAPHERAEEEVRNREERDDRDRAEHVAHPRGDGLGREDAAEQGHRHDPGDRERPERSPRRGRGGAPPPHQHDDHRDDDRDPDRVPEREQDRPRGRHRVHEEQVPRAVVAVVDRIAGDERDRGVGGERGDVGERDEPALGPRHQPPARVGEQELDEDGEEEVPDHEPHRVGERAVRVGERAEEPGEPDGDHQQPRPVPRIPCVRDEARADERPAEEEPEHGGHDRARLVVARQRERRRADPDGDRGERDRRDAARPHAGRRAASAGPESSAFGTNPRAPQPAISDPKSLPSRDEVNTIWGT